MAPRPVKPQDCLWQNRRGPAGRPADTPPRAPLTPPNADPLPDATPTLCRRIADRQNPYKQVR